MSRYFILEDDFFIVKIWQSLLRKNDKKSIVSHFPSISALRAKYPVIEDLQQDCDIIISDIFLSGDETGVDFIHSLTPAMQARAILSSAVKNEMGQKLLQEKGLACHYIEKPISLCDARSVLNKLGANLDSDFSDTSRIDLRRCGHSPVLMITGASSGIGLALADLFSLEKSYRLVLTTRTRSEEFLKQRFADNKNVMVVLMDLTKENQIKDVIDDVLLKWKGIDILINNAGICFRSVTEHMDSIAELEQMQTNYLGPMTLIRFVLPSMRENGRGKIINISSASGLIGMPTMGSYSASKHALEGASEALWHELKPFGIDVSIVRPGFINSDGHKRTLHTSKGNLAALVDGPFADCYLSMVGFISYLMARSSSTPKSIAEKIQQIIKTENPQMVYNVTVDALILSILKRLIPSKIFNLSIFIFFTIKFNLKRGHASLTPRRQTWIEKRSRQVAHYVGSFRHSD